MPSSPASPSSFLNLPIELRYNIYDYLSPKEGLHYPCPSSPITTLSCKAPPRQMLLTCHQICDEIQAYYYRRVTLEFIFPRNTPINREDLKPGTLAAVRRARRVELVLKLIKSVDPCWAANGWVGELARLLKDEGRDLELVIISITCSRVIWDEASEFLKSLLAPLRILKGRVRFDIGNIIAFGHVEDAIRKRTQLCVRDLNN